MYGFINGISVTTPLESLAVSVVTILTEMDVNHCRSPVEEPVREMVIGTRIGGCARVETSAFYLRWSAQGTVHTVRMARTRP